MSNRLASINDILEDLAISALTIAVVLPLWRWLIPSGINWDTLLRQPISSYPAWLQGGLWPLDYLVLLGLLFLALRAWDAGTPEPYRWLGWLLVVLRASFLLLGPIVGIIFTLLGGWYVGLVSYITGSLMIAVMTYVYFGAMSVVVMLGEARIKIARRRYNRQKMKMAASTTRVH